MTKNRISQPREVVLRQLTRADFSVRPSINFAPAAGS